MMKEDSIRISLSPGVVISPELHSQFIEHLGSCIYNGIWVGKDSDIPISKVSERCPAGAAKNRTAGRPLAGRLPLPIPTTGRTASEKTVR